MNTFAPNGYGLYDMAGSMWQWCWDWHGAYSTGLQTDPRGPVSASYRVFRGGAWYIVAFYCRTADRDFYFPPYYNGGNFGFRSVLPPGQ